MDFGSHEEKARRFVQFLEDQMNIGELLKSETPPQIFESVLMIKGDMIHIRGDGTRIDSFTKLEGGKGLYIGRGVHIASFAHIGIGGGETVLEDYCAVASGGKVISGSNDVSAASMSATAPKHMQRIQASSTVIGKYAVVLVNAVVLPGVTLGEGAVLAAGGVATKDIPAWEIWAGNPARFMKIREIK